MSALAVRAVGDSASTHKPRLRLCYLERLFVARRNFTLPEVAFFFANHPTWLRLVISILGSRVSVVKQQIQVKVAPPISSFLLKYQVHWKMKRIKRSLARSISNCCSSFPNQRLDYIKHSPQGRLSRDQGVYHPLVCLVAQTDFARRKPTWRNLFMPLGKGKFLPERLQVVLIRYRRVFNQLRRWWFVQWVSKLVGFSAKSG